MEIERLYELSPLEYARHYNDQGLGWGMSDGTTRGAEARALIAKLINAEIERQFELEGWIKVGNYLPNDDVASVLIYTKNGGVAEGQYYPTIKSWKQFRWSVEDAEVTHWRPMPEPPERGDE